MTTKIYELTADEIALRNVPMNQCNYSNESRARLRDLLVSGLTDYNLSCRIVTSARIYSSIRGMLRDEVDNSSSECFMETGILSKFWGAGIWVTRKCPENEIRFYGLDDLQLELDFPLLLPNIID